MQIMTFKVYGSVSPLHVHAAASELHQQTTTVFVQVIFKLYLNTIKLMHRYTLKHLFPSLFFPYSFHIPYSDTCS